MALGQKKELPHEAQRSIIINHEDLPANWNLAINGQKLFPIKGLDQ